MQLFKNKMQNEYYSKADLDIFISHYKKDANKIFREIYTYLKKKEYTSENEFINNYKVMISKEKNKIKELSNGLLLQLGNPSGALELTDKYVLCHFDDRGAEEIRMCRSFIGDEPELITINNDQLIVLP